MTDLNVSQLFVEVWMSSDASPTLRVPQIYVEYWVPSQMNPNVRFTQFAVEYWVSTRALGLTYPIYPTPPGLTYSVHWRPEFANLPTQRAANKGEIDIGLAATPIHEFELTYSFLRNSIVWAGESLALNEFKNFMGFFLRLRANAGRFLFWHPDDNTVTDEFVGTADGVTTDFGPLQRTFGVDDNVGIEPVGYVRDDDLVNYPIVVYFDGVAQSAGIYTIDKTFPCRQMISFLLAPADTTEITIDYSYYYYVKFAEDNMSFEKFMQALWTVKRVTLRSLRYRT